MVQMDAYQVSYINEQCVHMNLNVRPPFLPLNTHGSLSEAWGQQRGNMAFLALPAMHS